MFTKLFEYYNLSNYDTRPGAGISMSPNKTLGKTSGSEIQRGDIYDKFEIEEEDIDIDDSDLESIGKKLNQPVYKIDSKRSDLSHAGGGQRQTGALNEEHTNPIRKNSISPYKQKKFTGPPIGAGNANKMITLKPGRKTGTVYGLSRAPIIPDNDPLDFGESTKDKYEISFLRQQKNINRIKNLVKEIEKDKFNDKSSYS